MLDPTYQIGLPPRQLRNGVYDAFTHSVDQFLTSAPIALNDDFFLSVVKELVTIGPDVVKPNPPYELVSRLAIACSFACNQVLALGKTQCWGIHGIGHMLTAEYGIDHGSTLSIVSIPFFQAFFEQRKFLLAKSGAFVFDLQGTEEEKAKGFIDELRKFIVAIGQPLKVSDVEGVTVKAGDVEKITQMVMKSRGGKPFGIDGCVTEDIVRSILTQVVL